MSWLIYASNQKYQGNKIPCKERKQSNHNIMATQMRSDSTSTLCTTIVFITGHVLVLFYILVQRARITCFRCRCVRCLRHFVCLARMCYFQLSKTHCSTFARHSRAGQDRAWQGRSGLGCAVLGRAVLGWAEQCDFLGYSID